jgi:hypothetical protein
MGPSGEDSRQQGVMRFRVDRMMPADIVPHLTEVASELKGKIILTIKDLDGPITNYSYRPEEIAPHLDAIHEAINTARVYTVETDNTASTWPHNPDPRGYVDARILRAIAQRQFADDDPETREADSGPR